MNEQDKSSATKPVEEMSAYERWELPNLNPNASAQSVKPLTAEDLELIRADAYQEGLKQGRQDGLNQGLEQGRKKGLEQGRQEGLEQGRKLADQELTTHQQSLEQLAKALLQPIEEQQARAEQILLNTVLALVRAVINQETQLSPTVIQQALSTTIASLPKQATDIAVQLNPADHALVQEVIEKICPDASIQGNPAISRGGCIVESSEQVLDYTIEKRFQHIVQAMLVEAASATNFEAHQESPQSIDSHSDYATAVLAEGDQLSAQASSKTPPIAPSPSVDGDDALDSDLDNAEKNS